MPDGTTTTPATTRIPSLSMLLEDGGKAYLAELYARTIENVQKNTVSDRIKNRDLSGDPVSGTVEAKRFANAEAKDYGTARKNGKGDAVKIRPVVIAIDQDKEFVEELENKDVRLLGVDGVLERRAANHVLRMSALLDREFFRVAGESATETEIPADSTIEDELETLIQACETTENDYVDGVPRSMMNLVLSPAKYGKIRTQLDKTSSFGGSSQDEEFVMWHGVKAFSSTHLPTGVSELVMVDGAVAQPVMADQYSAEKVNLSNAIAVELFFHYGTKAVTPDLIFKPKFVSGQT